MTRIETWPAELARLLLEWHARPFDVATNNCAHFAAEWLRRATGRVVELPPVADMQAMDEQVISRGGMQAAVTTVLGDPLPLVMLAGRGDIGITETPRGDALCVVVGPTVAAPGRDGLVYLRRSRLIVAWRV